MARDVAHGSPPKVLVSVASGTLDTNTRDGLPDTTQYREGRLDADRLEDVLAGNVAEQPEIGIFASALLGVAQEPRKAEFLYGPGPDVSAVAGASGHRAASSNAVADARWRGAADAGAIAINPQGGGYINPPVN
jgi:hypothetical protein